MKNWFTVIALGSVLIAGPAHATNHCAYRVVTSGGFLCPIHAGAVQCLSVSSITGNCDAPVRCFGGGLFECDLTLTPVSGPQTTCAPQSQFLPRGVRCVRAFNFVRGTATPTFSVTPSPTGTPAGAATATISPTSTAPPPPPTGTATATAIAVATATQTATVAVATQTATGTRSPTGTATGMASATITSTPVGTATQTNTPVSIATNTATGTATATAPSANTATATGSPTDTGTPVGTATVSPTITPTPPPGSTSTATGTNTVTPTATTVAQATAASTATNTNTPVSTGTNTGTPTVGATNTATLASTATLTATPLPASTNTPVATNTATATRTSTGTSTATPAATSTATSAAPCPLAAGKYTTTQTSGGQLKVYTFQPFPFPAGGTIVQDVKAASMPDCVHDTVVPFPDGFSAPHFCVPALGYTVSVTQTGCGIGRIDSNGGSDFTVNEVNDTSDASSTCNLPQAGCVAGANASSRVDVTVGNGTADTCSSGTANAIVTVPVHTVTWQDNSPGMFGSCMGNGTFDQGTDTIITQFNQVLDFTTDTTHSMWSDIDGDGCSIAGGGPAAGQAAITGTCMNLTTGAVTTVASGGFGSTGIPNDGSFSTTLPNIVTGPQAALNATCGSPPPINFAGTATRCLQ